MTTFLFYCFPRSLSFVLLFHLTFPFICSLSSSNVIPRPPLTQNSSTSSIFSPVTARDLHLFLRNGPPVLPDFQRKLRLSFPTALPSSLVSYLRWHHDSLLCLYRPTFRECSKKKLPKILLWRCRHGNPKLCSGTGDRLRGITSALALAMVTDRLFMLEWPDNPYPFIHGMSPCMIDWRVPDVLKKKKMNIETWATLHDSKGIFQHLSWYTCPQGYHCNTTITKTKKHGAKIIPFSFNMSKIGVHNYLKECQHDIVVSTLGTFSISLFSQPDWLRKFYDFNPSVMHTFDMPGILLQNLFEPSTVVKSIMHSYIPLHARQHGYVAVHARTGVDVGESKDPRFSSISQTRVDVIARRFLTCATMNGLQKNGYVFIASDSTSLKQTFRTLAKHHGYRVLYSRTGGLHVAHFHDDDDNVNEGLFMWESQKYHKFVNVFVEFFAIAGASVIVSNPSEFSHYARAMSHAKVHRIFNVTDPVNGLKKCHA